MKKQLKSLLLVALLIGYALPTWAQASTEGKEFWVALNMCVGTAGGEHKPFVCITTQHPNGTYTITNPADPSFQTVSGPIPLNGYIKINASTSPTANEIDLNKWYPVGQSAQAMSNQIKNVGLKITTTVESSVFVGNMNPQSFDAANILPITALQTDYITQDYPGYEHEDGKGGGYPVTTVLATENNTKITINPSSAVINNGTSTITKTLNAGQVLYLTGEQYATLSGTTITSDKKIAVFTGVNNTDVPGPVSARDHLYEQNMPVDYWGTHFVVTRSMKKDANRIRVTASNNGTDISIDGDYITTINAGDTYEFELCSATMRTEEGYTKALEKKRGTDLYYTDYAHYLETSCPCAVFSYDVSENYYIKKNGTSERDENAHGDPSMVWISPLEQRLRKITFGVMNTANTTTHYVNIITPTEEVPTLEVREVDTNAGTVVYGNNMVTPSDIQPVPGNPAYSYARIKLVENKEKVYTITSNIGFIAHVYGSGNKESYAYSCGSAAVQQGVNVNGITFTDGYISPDKFCMGDSLNFDAKVGTDEITRVDWDFGDGTSEEFGKPQTKHLYLVPGWYDVTANLYGHQVCTDDSEQPLGSVSLSFRVDKPDTIKHVDWVCVEEDYTGPESTEESVKHDCDSVVITKHLVLRKSSYEYSHTANDQYTLNGVTYTNSQDVTWVIPNRAGCDSTITCHLTIIKCLDLQITNQPELQKTCAGETWDIPFSYDADGKAGDAKLIVVNGKTYPLSLSGAKKQDGRMVGTITLPITDLAPNNYVMKIQVEDVNCKETATSPDLNFTVRYPEDVFVYKFNNVLAVYQKGFGGNKGYDFVSYQWYHNDIEIPNATEPIYHTTEPFVKGDTYYVVLTDKNGMVLPSCPKTIDKVDDYNKPNAAPAQKRLINKRIYIIRDGRTYDAYGQRVQ